jgi:hypothetical protein
MVRILQAHVVADFTIWLSFSDGTEGRVDLSGELDGPVFEPLKDAAYFSQLRLDPETRTIAWPNGADFAPEFLYRLVKLAAA